MAEDITFIVHKEWLDSISKLPVEQQDKIIADIVRYGTESQQEYEDDPVIAAFVGILKSRIDFSKTKYMQKIEMAKSAGRKKKVDDEEILRLARKGLSAQQIADKLGYSKSSVDHSEGWKRRLEVSKEEKIDKNIETGEELGFLL